MAAGVGVSKADYPPALKERLERWVATGNQDPEKEEAKDGRKRKSQPDKADAQAKKRAAAKSQSERKRKQSK